MNNEAPEDRFRQLLSTRAQAKYGVVVKLNVPVDGILGTMRILWTPHSGGTWNLDFTYVKICCQTIECFDVHYHTIDQLFEGIQQLATMKIVGEVAMTPENAENFAIARNAVHSLMGIETESCYVCMGDTYGNTTICGHHICLKCYLKSVNKRSQEFKCGMCRVVEDCCV